MSSCQPSFFSDRLFSVYWFSLVSFDAELYSVYFVSLQLDLKCFIIHDCIAKLTAWHLIKISKFPYFEKWLR